jgi:threonylcarbamoyladenosine tRNA methylthiotransferase MtaB
MEGVSRQMSRLVEHGYREVVLTGIHLGQWGRDLDPPRDLTSLLTFLSQEPLPARVRLSSLEPMEWTGALLGKLASWPWVCPHFHVPLQSGDEEILRGMHRPYTPRRYEELVRELRFRFPEAAIGADVLAGFPGETEKEFQNTLRLVSELPLTYLHVFPYSPRPGTLAARWPERATSAELKRRVRILNKLSGEKRQAFRERFMGRCLEVSAETRVKPGWWQGTSENYLQVRFQASRDLPQGTLVRVRVTGSGEQALLGEPLAILQ